MITNFYRSLGFISLFIIGTSPCMAQYSFYNKPKIEKWFYGGGGHFFGDLGGKQADGVTIGGYDEIDFTNFRPAFGAGIRYNATRWFALRVGLNYTHVNQSDAKSFNKSQNHRNLSFKTDIIEASVLTELKVASFSIKTKKRKSFWEYYVFGGVGGFYFNPKAEYGGKMVALRPLTTEGQGLKTGLKKYGSVATCFPVGGGIRLGTGFNSSIFLEVGYRVTTTDYIDDVSGSYYNYDDLLLVRGKTSADMSYRGDQDTYPTGRTRGNPYNKDSYLIVNIGFSTSLKSRRLIRFHGR